MCRCRAKQQLYGFRVCDYHVGHGESDPPCPYCLQYRLFDPRWTYTTTGREPSKLVHIRQVNLPNTVFLDGNGEIVLSVESVSEFAPRSWSSKKRQTVVMIGVGLQMGTTFTITQWATDWEQALMDAAAPTLALANKVYTLGYRDVRALNGGFNGARGTVPWPTINVEPKMINATTIFNAQGITPNPREHDINQNHVARLWTGRHDRSTHRDQVWRHNYLNVLDLAMRVFQIEWPEDANA